MTLEQLAALPEAVERLREAITPPLPGQTILGIELDGLGVTDLRLVLEGLATAAVDAARLSRNGNLGCNGCQITGDNHSDFCNVPLYKQFAAALARVARWPS